MFLKRDGLKHQIAIIFVLIGVVALGACSQNPLYQSLTEQEMGVQQAADAATALIIFDNQLDQQASYIVDATGRVHIKFTEQVSFVDYNRVVEQMRSDANIRSVYAEQSGSEVCPLNQ
ncbi:hypothetical protein THMIRHAS_11750 [Thiosulfatimonas sediminis]|uniref:Uncharacterized protein n=2 Tax=Thiosulfatimonas sediminis TaxID=2675054 RepID=A0A6F8PUI0_9GAMM|nr:hypothetical protein THMIRHAS_11750 [Thiosulfatimonas sediminis]